MAYQPIRAKKAAAESDPTKLLALENFPSLVSSPIATTPRLDFLKRVKESEEERRRREEAAIQYDPNGIIGKSDEALEEMGWKRLILPSKSTG